MRLDATLLVLDGRDVSFAEVLGAARLAGLLDESVGTLSERLACSALAREEGLEVSEDEIGAAVDAWRLENDLVAAADATAWLERHELELDDLCAHVEARLQRDRLGERVAEALDRTRPFPDEVSDELPAFSTFEGDAGRLAEAVAVRLCAPPARDPGALAAERTRLLAERPPTAIAPWVADAEASFRLWLRSVATRDALGNELAAGASDLLAIELVEAAGFPTEDAAREVLLCVREDGEALEEVAKRAGVRVERVRRRVEDLPRTTHTTRLCVAVAGETVGPAPAPGGFVVHQVLGRHEPSIDDADVLGRLERRLVKRLLGPEVLRRVVFRQP